MELLITCYACKSASCKRVIGVIPYMPYSRHSELEPISVISSPLLQGRKRRCHGTPSHGVRLQDLHREGALACIFNTFPFKGSQKRVDYTIFNLT